MKCEVIWADGLDMWLNATGLANFLTLCSFRIYLFTASLTELFTQCEYQWLQQYVFAYPSLLWPRNVLVHMLLLMLLFLLYIEGNPITPADRPGFRTILIIIRRSFDWYPIFVTMNGIRRWCWCRNSTEWMRKIEHAYWGWTLKWMETKICSDIRPFRPTEQSKFCNIYQGYKPEVCFDKCHWLCWLSMYSDQCRCSCCRYLFPFRFLRFFVVVASEFQMWFFCYGCSSLVRFLVRAIQFLLNKNRFLQIILRALTLLHWRNVADRW